MGVYLVGDLGAEGTPIMATLANVSFQQLVGAILASAMERR